MCGPREGASAGAGAVLEETGIIVTNDKLAPTVGLAWVRAPRIAQAAQPGQFVHVGFPGLEAHLLRRPLGIMDVSEDGQCVALLYQTVGFATRRFYDLCVGAPLSLMGPIGRPWPMPDDLGLAQDAHVLVVAGGIGASPLFMHTRRLAQARCRVSVVLGAQSRQMLACRSAYEGLQGVDLVCTTDDGSFGVAGFATGPALQVLEQGCDMVCCCGPEPLMAAVSRAAFEKGVPTYVSLERRMACGIGACLSCVVDTTSGKRRACVDGPIFDAAEVVWS